MNEQPSQQQPDSKAKYNLNVSGHMSSGVKYWRAKRVSKTNELDTHMIRV